MKTRSFMAYQVDGMETPPMHSGLPLVDLRPLACFWRVDPATRATPEEMRESGFVMDYTVDGYGRLFGRWPEGTAPVALVPARDEAA